MDLGSFQSYTSLVNDADNDFGSSILNSSLELIEYCIEGLHSQPKYQNPLSHQSHPRVTYVFYLAFLPLLFYRYFAAIFWFTILFPFWYFAMPVIALMMVVRGDSQS